MSLSAGRAAWEDHDSEEGPARKRRAVEQQLEDDASLAFALQAEEDAAVGGWMTAAEAAALRAAELAAAAERTAREASAAARAAQVAEDMLHAREAQAADDLALALALQAEEDAQESVAQPPPPPLPQPVARCGLPGCVRNAARFGFCTDEHASRARARALLPPPGPHVERVVLAPSGTHTCLLLTKADPERAQLISQFNDAWRKAGRRPRVQRVYRINSDPRIRARHDEYRARVGNVRRRFHGTRLGCNFGIDLAARPCDRTAAACPVCSILEHGFSLARAGTGPNAALRTHLRYGRGLYFSATSGKSNDYAAESERVRNGRAWRCMLVAQVAAGKAFCTQRGELDLADAPPDGHDSVVGEVGAELNFDELVVYDEAAAIAEFLLVYTL